MAFCGKCGTQINDGVRFCPGCGAAAEVAAAPQPVAAGAVQQPAAPSAQPVQQPVQPSYQQPVQPNAFQKLNDTADITGECDPQDIANNKIMAVLSYFGPLFLIPWFAAPNRNSPVFTPSRGCFCVLWRWPTRLSAPFSALSSRWIISFGVTARGSRSHPDGCLRSCG